MSSSMHQRDYMEDGGLNGSLSHSPHISFFRFVYFSLVLKGSSSEG